MSYFETELSLAAIKKLEAIDPSVLYTGFYASDCKLNGGEIKHFASHGFIVETGNTRQELVRVGRNKTIDTKVKEWKVDSGKMWDVMDYYRDLAITMETIVDYITGCPEYDEE